LIKIKGKRSLIDQYHKDNPKFDPILFKKMIDNEDLIWWIEKTTEHRNKLIEDLAYWENFSAITIEDYEKKKTMINQIKEEIIK